MCGIFGIVNPPGQPVSGEILKEGIRTMQHRGPEHSGVYLKENMGLANCRLPILDLGKRSNQPFQYCDMVITYNGCIFNFRQIKAELMKEGMKFQTSGDTEVVLAAYYKWGQQCVEKFNGMWAFCIYDPKKNLLFCSRDRFGIKPLYYVNDKSVFRFGSEIKSLISTNSSSPVADSTKVLEYLAFGFHDHTNCTLFKQTYSLPPGHNLTYSLSNHQMKIHRYFDLRVHTKFEGSEAEMIGRFSELFFESVEMRLQSDVPLGFSLSGGLDSSSVVAASASLSALARQYRSYCVSYDVPGADESKYAQLMSNRTGIQVQVFSPRPEDFQKDVDKLIYHQDEPLGSLSAFGQLGLFLEAKTDGVKVVLGGQGGDEILAGYDKFHIVLLRNALRQSPVYFSRELLKLVQNNQVSPQDIWSRFLLVRSKQLNRVPSWLNGSSEFLSPEYVSRFDTLSDVTVSLFGHMGLQALLHYEDRNSMAASIESRLPFLDHRLVRFSLEIPDHMKINNGVRKFILRESLKNHLPPEVRQRKDKMGFIVPAKSWMRSNRENILREVSEGFKQYSVFNDRAALPKSLSALWRVYQFCRWMKVFNVQEDFT